MAGAPPLFDRALGVARATRRRGAEANILTRTIAEELVERLARERGCCKVTLEVLEGNTSAQAAYRRAGFEGYQLDPLMGRAMFWQKWLS